MKKALTALAVLTALTAPAQARPRHHRHYHHQTMEISGHRPLGYPREPAHGRQLLAGHGRPAPGTTNVPNPIRMGIDDNKLQLNKDRTKTKYTTRRTNEGVRFWRVA
jgi:hypothetical protein